MDQNSTRYYGRVWAKRSARFVAASTSLEGDPYLSIELHKNIEIHTEYPCLVTKFATSYRFRVTGPGQDPWYASPRCKDCIKSTVLFGYRGRWYQCGACHADEVDAPRFERCVPGDWTLMDATFSPTSGVRMRVRADQRLRQVTFREDIAI
jgi:hypothetical protein